MGVKVNKQNNGISGQLEYQIFGFGGLLNINSLPHELGDSDLSVALNVYGDVLGGVRMRRGMTLHGAKLSSTPCQGGIRFWQEVVAGAPLSTPTAVTLAQIGGTLWNADTNTQIGATNALGVTAGPWSVARMNNPDDGSGSTDSLIICTGVGGPYLYNGTTITTPAGWSAAAGAKYCVVSNATLFFSGIGSNPNFIWQSQVNHPTLFANSFNTSYPVTGLSSLGAGSQSGLVYGMTKGLGVTFGQNLYNLYSQEIPHVDGVYGRTMVSYNGLVYYLGDTNFYVFDGQNIKPIGGKVRPWVTADPRQPDYPMNGNRNLSFAWYYDQFIYFGYDSGSVGYCNTYLVYHVQIGEWTVLSGPIISAAFLLDAPIVDPSPHGCVVADARGGQLYNWDVFNGVTSSIPDGRGVNDLVYNTGTGVSDIVPISSSVLTKFFRLAPAGQKVTLRDVFPEFFIDTIYSGNVQIASDYNDAVLTELTIPFNLLNVAATWAASIPGNASNFNWAPLTGSPAPNQTANWLGGSGIQFVTTGLPVDQTQFPTANSVAFGCSTQDLNPPYIFAGVSGTFVIEPRQLPSSGGLF